MNSEFNIFGVFVPALLVYAAAALAGKELVCRLLLRFNVYRFVWHRPLFDTALFVILLGVIAFIGHQIHL